MNMAEQWLSVKKSALKAIRSTYYIRSLVRKGKLESRRNKDGEMEISESSIVAYLKSVEEKEQERQAKVIANIEGKHMRPTTKAVKRITSKVVQDKTLTSEQKQLFLARLKAYEAEWDAKYAEKHPEA